MINSNFYTMAMYSGLSAGIINPSSEDMMRSFYAYHALMNLDENFGNYIERFSKVTQTIQTVSMDQGNGAAGGGMVSRALEQRDLSVSV